jgi:hypothetical protein
MLSDYLPPAFSNSGEIAYGSVNDRPLITPMVKQSVLFLKKDRPLIVNRMLDVAFADKE